MSVITYECVVENGQVHLPSEAVLPEKATVYLVVPQAASEPDDLEVIVLEPLSSRKTPVREFLRLVLFTASKPRTS